MGVDMQAGDETWERRIATLEARMEKLREVKEFERQTATYTDDEYVRGLANGLTLAESIMLDKEPRLFAKAVPEKPR